MPADTAHPWWHRTTIYQIYPRSFLDSNGDGIGDLRGIIDKLDYVRDLGVETVWISPFFASPQVDFGYDITDYLSVAPEYGGLADVDRLIDEAHARGLKVMFDLVLNHTSDRHPWFVESRSSRVNPKRDWYVWADGKGKRKPNNWRAANLISSAWSYDPVRGQYYLASFLPCQPDLNYHNPEVKRTMLDVVRFWLRRGVDGFRLDMFGAIMKDRALRSNPLNRRIRFTPGLPVPELFSQKYNSNTEECFAFARELRAVCDAFAAPERVLLGEVFGTPAVLRRYLGHDDGLHLVFLFDFLRFTYDADFFRARIREYERELAAPLVPTYVLSNHDRMRSCSRVGGDLRKARVLAVLLLTLRGVPTLYMGEEVGMTNTPVALRDARDVMAKTFAFLGERGFRLLQRLLGETLNRDEVRTPMQWDASTHAGFCRTDVEPWLPVHCDKHERSVAAQASDADSLLGLHRRLLRMRRERPCLGDGALTLLDGLPSGVLAYTRRCGADHMTVYLNFAGAPRAFAAPNAVHLELSTDAGNALDNRVLRLQPDSGVIVAAERG
jgi:glycosidase